MPKLLNELVTSYDQLSYSKQNPNQAVVEWARDLFTVNGQLNEDDKLVFNLLISNQPCARDLNDYDDIQYKLTKIGVQFNVIKNIQNTQEASDDADDDEDNQFFNPESKFMLNDMSTGKNRRQIKRLQVYATPTLYPNWMSISSTNVLSTNNAANEADFNTDKDLVRLQPSLSTPDQAAAGFTRTANLGDSHAELTTPHYPPSVLSNIYSTPSFAPEPPTDYLISTDNLITPTPTLTFIVSDTAKEFSNSFGGSNSNLESIAPSSTLTSSSILSSSIQPDAESQATVSTVSSQIDYKTIFTTPAYSFNASIDDLFKTTFSTSSTITSTTSTTEKPLPKKPKIFAGNMPDHAPIIKERIPRLRLISGVYFTYAIPGRYVHRF